MSSPSRRCPQCGDNLEHRRRATIVLQDVENVKPGKALTQDRFVSFDQVYLNVQVWGCPVCGHIELVDEVLPEVSK